VAESTPTSAPAPRAGPDTPLIGLALAGGAGLRARPLTLAAPDYLRSKAALSLAGRSLIDWEVGLLATQGVAEFYIVAKGRENRAQIKELLGHGDAHGVSVRYSRPRFDGQNTGSGEATLRALDHWRLEGTALVFPTDSVFDFDLDAVLATHTAAGAVVTVTTVARTPEESAGKYGVLRTGGTRVLGFREKPGLDEARNLAQRSGHEDGLLDVNAGMYVIDCARLRRIAADPKLRELAGTRLDWGGDLLPFLIGQGHPVAAHRIARFGDLGTPRDYLETLGGLLRGEFPLLTGRLAPPLEPGGTVRVHPSSLRLADSVSGLTLARKLAEGRVRLGPHVTIGRDVEIGPDTVIEGSAVGDGVDIGAGAVLRGVACGDHAIIGPAARLTDVVLGSMAVVESNPRLPTELHGFTAIGDEARIRAGARLQGVHVFPRVEVAAGPPAPPGTVIERTRPGHDPELDGVPLAGIGEGVQ
jgi:NDP-sugar pyrophosphorylase family protein